MASDFGFAGMYKHERSGLNLTLFRAYDPTIGRWLSRDPLGEGTDATRYSYCWNDPINGVDPLGLWEIATYNRSTGAFTSMNAGTGSTVSFSGQGGQIFSGMPGFRSPAFEGVSNKGPIPSGTYFIGPMQSAVGNRPNGGHFNVNYFPIMAFEGGRMTGMLRLGRYGAEIHSGQVSKACVTFKSNVGPDSPQYPSNSDFDTLRDRLNNGEHMFIFDPIRMRMQEATGVLIVE